MSVILALSGLRKSLRTSSHAFDLEVPALELERGRFYGLVGKSGSGKSTMLDMLAMVSSPTEIDRFSMFTTSGTVNIAALLSARDDAEISRVRLRHYGYILQSGGLFEFLTVRQNLELPMLMTGRRAASGEIEAMCAPFEITPHLDKRPSALSGGQRQRVSIIRALSLAPEIVLADEPTASVDETMADRIVRQLKDLAASKGSTVLMVSHDTDLIAQFSDETFHLQPTAISEAHTVSKIHSGVPA